jgi:hypothetical protein
MAVKGTKPTNVTVMAMKESKITNRWQLRNAIIFNGNQGSVIIFYGNEQIFSQMIAGWW